MERESLTAGCATPEVGAVVLVVMLGTDADVATVTLVLSDALARQVSARLREIAGA